MAIILVVDDEQLIRKALGEVIEIEGHEALFAKDGREALHIISQQLPDLVVTDLLMPDIEGLELIREIRKISDDVKIIAISGGSRYFEPSNQLKAAELIGADISFSKPLDIHHFKMAVNTLLFPD